MALEQKRRELNRRLREERENYQKMAQERLKEIDTILTTKRPTQPEDPFDFLETQSDEGIQGTNRWDDDFLGDGNFSRGKILVFDK